MATAIMKQKGIPEMDDVEEIISKIWNNQKRSIYNS